MATIMIHWKDKDIPPMEIKNANYKGADSSIIKISTGGKEYWFNWNECWYIESDGIEEDRRR
jgi:hypothetical protein